MGPVGGVGFRAVYISTSDDVFDPTAWIWMIESIREREVKRGKVRVFDEGSLYEGDEGRA
eukprot:1388648-Amorphochlora_amoeboformis.AAC.1